MAIFKCSICDWEYDEDEGLEEADIAEGTKFEDLPDTFSCPVCGASKENFEEV